MENYVKPDSLTEEPWAVWAPHEMASPKESTPRPDLDLGLSFFFFWGGGFRALGLTASGVHASRFPSTSLACDYFPSDSGPPPSPTTQKAGTLNPETKPQTQEKGSRRTSKMPAKPRGGVMQQKHTPQIFGFRISSLPGYNPGIT